MKSIARAHFAYVEDTGSLVVVHYSGLYATWSNIFPAHPTPFSVKISYDLPQNTDLRFWMVEIEVGV